MSGWRKGVTGGVPSAAGKSDVWLMVATAIKEKRWKKTSRNKNWGAGFSLILASDFLFFNAYNPPLFIKGGRWIYYLY